MFTLFVVRVILLIATRWHFKILKYMFYLEVIGVIQESVLPLERNPADLSWIITIVGLLNFTLDYFHFWPALACTYLQTIVYFLCQSMYSEDPFSLL